jgi:putative membrane protein
MTRAWLGAVVAAAMVAGPGLASAQSPRGTLSSADRKFVEEAAEGGQMEVELGQMAKQKASNDAVKQFGERMATDHSKANQELAKANQELAQLASSKGMELPKQPDRKAQSEHERLSKASGSTFDREYVKTMVKDHEKDVAAFKRASKDAKDPDVKAWAAKTLPTLEDHLKSIKQIESQVASK